MIDFLIDGGIVFTLPMTGLFIFNVMLIVRAGFFLYMKNLSLPNTLIQSVDNIVYLGIFLLSIGFLGQVLGLYSAFQVIESNAVQVTSDIMLSGIKNSSTTTILGLIFFVVSFGAWYILKNRLKALETQ